MIDRLSELRALNKKVEFPRHESHNQLQMGDSAERYQQNLEGISGQFFEYVKNARALMGRIRDNNEKIKEARLKYAKAIKTSQEKEISDQLNAIVSDNKEIHTTLKQNLQDMKRMVEQAENDEQQKNQPQTRMKKNFYMCLNSQLSKTLEQQRIQEDSFKNTVKEKVGRQVKLIDSNLNDEEVEYYVNNPQEAAPLLQQKIYGKASVSLQNAVNDIQDKLRDVQRLERSVAQCLQLFKELAILVQQQGALIDNIEANVMQTKDYVEKAEKNLKKAKEHHKCARKWMWWIILAAVVILVIILVPVIVKATGG